jgi:hypothetical protein
VVSWTSRRTRVRIRSACGSLASERRAAALIEVPGTSQDYRQGTALTVDTYVCLDRSNYILRSI